MYAGSDSKAGFVCWPSLVGALLFSHGLWGHIAFAQADPPAQGKVYHVSQNHAKADDANPGTKDLPWRTIGKAASVASAGDTVRVHGGVYREEVRVTNSGRLGSPITFRADKGKVTITGSDLVKIWARHSGNVYCASVGWWAMDGWIKCKGRAGNWDGEGGKDTDEVFEDGVPLRETATIPGKPGRFYFDHDKKMVYVWCSDSADPNTKTLEAIRRGHCLVIKGSHIRVEGFILRNVSLRVVFIRGGDNNEIVNNVLKFSAADSGIHLSNGADHNLVRNNRISNIDMLVYKSRGVRITTPSRAMR